MNYCPLCKREFKGTSGRRSRHCPVCGSTLVELSADGIAQVRHRNRQEK